MRLLIIGGSKFLGRHIADTALLRGHQLTVFNRGKITAGFPSGVEYIRGDRHRDLDRLAGRTWDAVIDTCGYLPQSLRLSTRALASSVGQYVFISSISAYSDFSKSGMDEAYPLAELSAEQKARFDGFDLEQDVTAPLLGEAHGPLKAACERVVKETMGDGALNVRPGLIAGPFDPTDRFTYWVMRIARAGEFLAPGRPDRFVQFIDARDLSNWIVSAIEAGVAGDYNLNGPPFNLTMGQMLEAIQGELGGDSAPVWVDDAFIEREEIQPWSELPLYMRQADAGLAGFMAVNVDKALATGLETRQVDATTRDTFEWRRGETFPMRAGIDADREAQLLRKWREQIS